MAAAPDASPPPPLHCHGSPKFPTRQAEGCLEIIEPKFGGFVELMSLSLKAASGEAFPIVRGSDR